jgi:amidase
VEVVPPSREDIQRIAGRHGLGLDAAAVDEYTAHIATLFGSYPIVDAFPPVLPDPSSGRDAGYRPNPEDNLLGAWYWRSRISNATTGRLAGRTLAVKDNIAVAGIPMMNGSRLLEGYVPEYDATVVSRVLAAGGTIEGKATCEDLCLSGGSHTCSTGPMRNPWDASRASGGSSGGSAILVATGEVDMALGGDQGGSIRIPSSWCGIVGHKPTYGLVPYTGAGPIEYTVDHIGPMARNVTDAALLLEVIAGPDGLDSRQRGVSAPSAYTKAIENDIRGVRIGVVSEGFGWPGLSQPGVDRSVRDAVLRLAHAGGAVSEIAIPRHRDGTHVWSVIATEGPGAQMVHGNGYGVAHSGFHSSSYVSKFGAARAARGNELSQTVKITVLMSDYLAERYHGAWYAKAQNAALQLTAAYDAALAEVDVLVMPTSPMVATPLPPTDAPLALVQRRAQEMMVNTSPFDVTGHPATTIPCGLLDGLPVGLMIVARHGEDATALQVARAFEQEVGGFENLIGRPSAT